MDSIHRKIAILEQLKAGKLETALKQIAKFQIKLKTSDLDQIITLLEKEVKQSISTEDFRGAKRFKRLIRAIKSLSKHGPDPANILDPVILPDGYNGKILLISISGGIIENTVILRSGDLWHHEILREAREEIKDLGLVNSEAYPLGGAWARFEEDGCILIWGTSDQFGACDKDTASRLLKVTHPNKQIKIE